MTILLKIILGLFFVLDFLITRALYKDFKITKNSEGYDEMTIRERYQLGFIFAFSLMALVALGMFLLYFIVIPMDIGWELWGS